MWLQDNSLFNRLKVFNTLQLYKSTSPIIVTDNQSESNIFEIWVDFYVEIFKWCWIWSLKLHNVSLICLELEVHTNLPLVKSADILHEAAPTNSKLLVFSKIRDLFWIYKRTLILKLHNCGHARVTTTAKLRVERGRRGNLLKMVRLQMRSPTGDRFIYFHNSGDN